MFGKVMKQELRANSLLSHPYSPAVSEKYVWQ